MKAPQEYLVWNIWVSNKENMGNIECGSLALTTNNNVFVSDDTTVNNTCITNGFCKSSDVFESSVCC